MIIIITDTIITINHILAVLLYANFTKHSYLFSSTYRKNDLYESDSALKHRHKEHFWWGRYLREAVEIYGEKMNHQKDIDVLYHGVSDSLLFNATNINLYGPVSTTAGLFCVFTLLQSMSYVFMLYCFEKTSL